MRKIFVVYHTLDENGVGCWLLARETPITKPPPPQDKRKKGNRTAVPYGFYCSGRDGKGRRWQVNDDHEFKIQKTNDAIFWPRHILWGEISEKNPCR